MQGGSTLNDILLELNNALYLSLIKMSSGYHSLKLGEKSPNLTAFACIFDRYRFKRLPFGATPVGDKLQRKIHKIFKHLPDVFGIADDLLVVGCDATL